MDVPVSELSDEEMDIILYGSKDEKIHFHYEMNLAASTTKNIVFEGVVHNMERRYRDSSSDWMRETDGEIHE